GRGQERGRLTDEQVAREVEEGRFSFGQRVEPQAEDDVRQPPRAGGFGRLSRRPRRGRSGFPVEELVPEDLPRCVEDRLTAHEYGFWSVYVDLHATLGIGPGKEILKGCGGRLPAAHGPAKAGPYDSYWRSSGFDAAWAARKCSSRSAMANG